jgi:hypothetical protein
MANYSVPSALLPKNKAKLMPALRADVFTPECRATYLEHKREHNATS